MTTNILFTLIQILRLINFQHSTFFGNIILSTPWKNVYVNVSNAITADECNFLHEGQFKAIRVTQNSLSSFENVDELFILKRHTTMFYTLRS